MPKSRNRKNHKKKVAYRNQRIRAEKNKLQKMMEEEFLKEVEKMKDRDLEIEEVSNDDTDK
jgi:hypothetical protein